MTNLSSPITATEKGKNCTQGMKILHLNVGTLTDKRMEINQLISEYQIDVAALMKLCITITTHQDFKGIEPFPT